MSAVTNTWRQLVQRRLWPVAILLIAALVAVPMLLAKEPTPPAPPPAVAANDEQSKSELAVTPIVTKADEPTKRRRVLGTAKNPFAKKAVDDAVTASNAPTGTSQTTTGPGGADTPAPSVDAGLGGGGSSAPAPTGPTPPVSLTPPDVPKPPAKKYSLHELTVRFGDASGAGGRRSVERLDPLPSAEEPVLIYLGLRRDGKTAEFLVDHGVQAVGDGECVPFPEQCERIFLREGETEFIDVVDATGEVTAQYQLDLIKIHNKGTKASAAKARKSSKAGRRALQARASVAGGSAGLG
jgi:hypothetical protein